MQLMLDGLMHDSDVNCLGDAITAGVDAARQSGRCVVEVYVDGAKISGSDLDREEVLAQQAIEVRLITAAASEIVRDAMLQSADALEQIDELQQRAADFIQNDRVSEAMGLLGEAMEVWGQVGQAVAGAADFAGLDLDSMEIDECPVPTIIARLNRQLTAMVEDLKHQDVVGLSDTLLYEMPDVISQWRRLLAEIADGARAGGGVG